MAEASAPFLDARDEAALLLAARGGETQAADVLWIQIRPAALAVARKITGNSHDAEDLASEAMIRVFTAIGEGHGPSEAPLAYVCATMRNLHISGLRRQTRTGFPVELNDVRALELVATEPDSLESEIVTSAFKSLPTRWRYVLWAQLVEGRNGSEIADDLGVKPAAVHALKSRALEGLRQGYLTEHAKLGELEECESVHRDLAALVRGRTRRRTDTAQLWRHLRGCEHCAESYRELSAMNNRIGALLGPASAAVVLLPRKGFLGSLGAHPLVAGLGKVGIAASLTGAVGLGATIAVEQLHNEPVALTRTAAAPASEVGGHIISAGSQPTAGQNTAVKGPGRGSSPKTACAPGPPPSTLGPLELATPRPAGPAGPAGPAAAGLLGAPLATAGSQCSFVSAPPHHRNEPTPLLDSSSLQPDPALVPGPLAPGLRRRGDTPPALPALPAVPGPALPTNLSAG
jgi:RNA polymerase sigma factor (sigma-70 family)